MGSASLGPSCRDAGDADAGDAGADLYTGILGSIGGTLYDETCPAGQFVIGVQGGESSYDFYDGILTKLRFRCGVPTLPAVGDGDVVVEAADFVPADPADARGGTDSDSISQAVCPEHQVVVGIDGDTFPKDFPPVRDVVAQVRLRCAPLAYVGDVVSIGAVELSAGSIGPAGENAAGPFDCGTGKVATGLRIHAGNIVDALQVRLPVAMTPSTPRLHGGSRHRASRMYGISPGSSLRGD